MMNGTIQNSPIRPLRTLQPHHIRHMISGTLVFLAGILAEEVLMHLKSHWPRTVRWSAAEIQKNYVPPTTLPATNVEVDIGISGDGSFVWRPRKQ